MIAAQAGFTIAVALFAGVFAQSLARHLRLPGIVLLLILGAVLGPEGLGWVQPRALGEGLYVLVEFGVAIILFEGGLNLEISRLRKQETPIRRLITIGALITFLGATVAARVVLDWPWALAFLFGSLVVVTGPTVVAPLLRDLRLHPRVKHILEAEGVLIDPIGALLAVLVLHIVMVPSADTVASELMGLALRIGFGVLAGIAGGFLIGWLLHIRALVPQGYENIFTFAAVVLLFFGCDHVIVNSGIIAVTIAGVVVGNLQTPVDRDLREFKDQLTVLLVALLFILLAADIELERVQALGWPGVMVIGALVLVVRPLDVFFSTAGTELTWRERTFVGWIGPRGIVAAAVASITASTMESQGMAGGAELRALVFMTIAGTVLLAGLTAHPVASALNLRLPGRDRIAILGIRPLSLALAEQLKQGATPLVFLDSDPYRCREAEEAGFAVVYGDALQERTLLRAQFDLVGTAIGFTANEHLNSLFVSQAKELFSVPKLCIASKSPLDREPREHLQRLEAELLFEAAHDMRRWDLRLRQGEAVIERFAFHPIENAVAPDAPTEAGPSGEPARAQESFLMLAVMKKQKWIPITRSLEPQEGDVASVVIFTGSRGEALSLLETLGWTPAVMASEDESKSA